MLVWLASYPRSGNAFLRVVLKSLYGVGSTTVYPKEAGGRLAKLMADPREKGVEEPVFTKTHELDAASGPASAIYLVRDGRDCYVSYAHFARALDPAGLGAIAYADVLKMLVESEAHFGGWSRHVETWTHRESPTALVRYEELLAAPAEAAAKACAALGIALPEADGVLTSVEELAAVDPRSFRKGKAGSWREEMPPELEELFWGRHGETMGRLGYPR